MYHTYIIENKESSLYIGQTSNLSGRLLRHNLNKVKSTKNKGSWVLVYKKEFKTRSLAMKHEKYLKSLKSKKYIKENIIGN